MVAEIWITSEIMEICGLQNAFEDIDMVTATIDPEQLLRRSPQVLVVVLKAV